MATCASAPAPALPAPRLATADRWARAALVRRLAGLRGGAIHLHDADGDWRLGAGAAAVAMESDSISASRRPQLSG